MKIIALISFTLMSFIAAAHGPKVKTVDVKVTEKGFEPSSITAHPGTDLTLRVTRTTEVTCAKQVQVPSKNLKLDLPLNKPVDVKLGKLEKGEVKFGCGMDMMLSAQILAK